MNATTTPSSPVHSNTQRVAKRRLQLHLRRLRHREYSKLRTLVPSVAHKNNVSKVTVIEEAIKYIDSLHKALVERLQHSQPAGGEDITEENVKEVVCHLMAFNANQRPLNLHRLEKRRKVPRFVQIQKRKSKTL